MSNAPDPKSLVVNDDRVLAELQKTNAQLREVMQGVTNLQNLTIEQHRHPIHSAFLIVAALAAFFSGFACIESDKSAASVLVISGLVMFYHACRDQPPSITQPVAPPSSRS